VDELCRVLRSICSIGSFGCTKKQGNICDIRYPIFRSCGSKTQVFNGQKSHATNQLFFSLVIVWITIHFLAVP